MFASIWMGTCLETLAYSCKKTVSWSTSVTKNHPKHVKSGHSSQEGTVGCQHGCPRYCWDPRCNGVPEGEPTGNVEITRIDWENRIEWGYTGKNMGIRTFAHCYQFWPSRCFLLIATRRHSAMKSQDHFCSWIAETCTCLDKSTHTYLSIYIYIHIIYENKYTYM